MKNLTFCVVNMTVICSYPYFDYCPLLQPGRFEYLQNYFCFCSCHFEEDPAFSRELCFQERVGIKLYLNWSKLNFRKLLKNYRQSLSLVKIAESWYKRCRVTPHFSNLFIDFKKISRKDKYWQKFFERSADHKQYTVTS